MKVSPRDNVMVAVGELATDSMIAKTHLRSQDNVAAGHKVTIRQIYSRSQLIKFAGHTSPP